MNDESDAIRVSFFSFEVRNPKEDILKNIISTTLIILIIINFLLSLQLQTLEQYQ